MEATVEQTEIVVEMAKTPKRQATPRRKASPSKPLITRTRKPSPPKRRRR
ncbi:MAG: hypothetical protein ISS52_06855 [Dehalococcoidia bacterium]|nr:hypothetical protein [Dehalococcoidia bacterium]